MMDLKQALVLAVQHIEHMAAWITERNIEGADYSFASLGEDMPGIKAVMTEETRRSPTKTVSRATPGRQWIIDLVREQYDKAPDHYRMGDNWDDGAPAIADAIIAQLPLLAAEQCDEMIEVCAVAAEAQDRAGYEWVQDSLWANILRRAGANVRKLKQLNTSHRPEGQPGE